MSTNHFRCASRPVARTLLCVVLALAVLVSPWESGLLPARMQYLTAALAAAQTPPPVPVEAGTPDPCSTDPVAWTPQPGDPGYLTSSECVLELPACPQSPLFSLSPSRPQFMRLSAPPAGLAARFPSLDVGYPDVAGVERHPDFCEERVLDTDPAHSACLAVTGHAVTEYVDVGQDVCRLLHPIKCPVGLYMDTSKTCRAVQRRNWVCDADQVPRNEFNTCYRLAAAAGTPHPACGPGAPDFVAMSCEEYVGSDFLADPAAVGCASTYLTRTPVEYPPGTVAVPGAPPVVMEPNYRSGLSSSHWCAYDTQYLLDRRCHLDAATRLRRGCALSMALCIKRASQTGGCDAIAETIRCRAYEGTYRPARAVPLEEVRLNGCSPCVILPFRPVPQRCSADIREEPQPGRETGVRDDYYVNSNLLVVHREEADMRLGEPECDSVRDGGESLDAHSTCAALPVCADPPHGTVVWEATHHSGLAVVNTPVIAMVTDIRLEESSTSLHYYNRSTKIDSPLIFNPFFRVVHEGDGSEDPRVRTRPDIDASASFSSVGDIAAGGECAVSEGPIFRLIVEELWPDNGPDYQPDCSVLPGDERPRSDAEAIRELFGEDSLRWWCMLSGNERRRRTLARGLEWWDDPTTDQAARVEELTEKADCNYSISRDLIWCRWVPARPGYYRLTGAGAWELARFAARLPEPLLMAGLLSWLNDPVDGTSRRLQLQGQLGGIGRDPAAIGLSSDFTAALPLPSTPDWTFSQGAVSQTNCPSIDLRISCATTTSFNYTETEPIGVMVHEMRVSTVTPSR